MLAGVVVVGVGTSPGALVLVFPQADTGLPNACSSRVLMLRMLTLQLAPFFYGTSLPRLPVGRTVRSGAAE